MIKSKVVPNPNQAFVDAFYRDKYMVQGYRLKIIDSFKIRRETLDKWLSGEIKIRPLYHDKIAEILSADVEELFPSTVN